jgi:hypothetical protein
MMRRGFLALAIALLIGAVTLDEASAQRGGFGGGFRGGVGISGGGFRGVGVGGGFRGVGVGTPAFRTAGIGVGRTGFVGRPGFGFVGRPGIIGRPGFIGRRGFIGRPGLRWAGGWRPGWGWGLGWGFPVLAGLAAASYSTSCVAWDGFRWVNICYSPYPYGYY